MITDYNKHTAITVARQATSILHIHFNRPEQYNALSMEMLQALYDILHLAKHDKAVKAILLTGEGKAFCAGADIKQLATLNGVSGLAFAHLGQRTFAALEQLGKPSLVAIQGFALGGGCELAMAATLRIAAKNAFLGQPEISLGIIPGFGGTQRLIRLVGRGRALEMCLTGRRVMAEEAAQWGLINQVVPADTLMASAMDQLNALTQYSAIALASLMTVIQQDHAAIASSFELEAAHFGVCCATKDKQEGVAAFLEKRPALFHGE